MSFEVSELFYNYYGLVHENLFLDTKCKIEAFLDEGLHNGTLDENSHKEMEPLKLQSAKFYWTSKVHKKLEPPQCPPVRPIISASGPAFKHIVKYTQYKIKDFGTKHDTLLKDTPHFLNSKN